MAAPEAMERRAAEGGGEEDRRPAGLCVNCERAEGCTYPKGGGVWCCEEWE